MLETFTPYFTMLPLGAALVISVLGVIPSLVMVVRAEKKKSNSAARTVFACGALLVGAWGYMNLATQLLYA